MIENNLILDQCTLVCLDTFDNPDLIYMKDNFAGRVVTQLEDLTLTPIMYLTGDINKLLSNEIIRQCPSLCVIEEFSTYIHDDNPLLKFIPYGQVPLNIHNVGVYFRRYFDDDIDYFS